MNTNSTNKEKTEIEAKFACPDTLALDDLMAALKKMDLQHSNEAPHTQTDIYFDTPTYTLLNSEAAIRIRQRDGNYLGIYKLSEKQQGTIFERKEFEWTLSNDEIRMLNEEKKPTVPPAIMEKLNLNEQSLRKVLVVETERFPITINDNGFKAELSLDVVTFRGHKGQKTYREIEIELLNGQAGRLKLIADNLQNQLKLQPAANSKYKIGMILVGKHGVKT